MTGTRELFTASLYVVTCVAGVMLAVAEGNWLLPAALTVPVAIAAFDAVERRGFGLSTLAANLLGLVAITVALIELAVRDIEGRLLFGAHLLVYLSWIVLWQRKGNKQYWGLMALAVLEVAVGAVLTNSGYYGLAMIVFLGLTIWTLILLQLHDAETRHVVAPGLAPSPRVTTPRVLLAGGSVAPAGQAVFGHWPFRQLSAAAAVTLLGAMTIGGAFFLLVPRYEVGRHAFDESDSPLARQRRTGFSERVRLGSFGEILESSEPVFEVRMFDADNVPIDVEEYASELGLEEPLFRGITLTDYQAGEWLSSQFNDSAVLPSAPFSSQIVQEYRLEPTGSQTRTLFAIAPVYAGNIEGTDQPIRMRRESSTLYGPSDLMRRSEIRYRVYSPSSKRRTRSLASDSPYFVTPLLQVPPQFDMLRQMAEKVARPSGGGPSEGGPSEGGPSEGGPSGSDATPRQRADRLLHFLRDSGEYTYSLSGELVDPELDPIEDFLINRKSGHCEYFASALALMLRAEGLPSRIVNGFKGGERNRLNGSFEVQQRHAHAWVEAYIDGEWTTLDPTPPAARNSSVAESAPALPLWNDLRSAIAGFWQIYIVDLNMGRQRATLEPIRNLVLTVIAAVRDGVWPALKELFYALATDPARWFSWQGGVVTFVGLFLIVALWRVGVRIKRRFDRLRAARAARGRRGRRVEFYERFRALCQRRGWSSLPANTPREFAAQIADKPAVAALAPGLASLPAELAEDFYEVRFGERDLPDAKVAALERRLSEFEAALAEPAMR